jgi:hypothetical protein
MSDKKTPVRFGAEFGPESMSGTTKGVGLGTFKRMDEAPEMASPEDED